MQALLTSKYDEESLKNLFTSSFASWCIFWVFVKQFFNKKLSLKCCLDLVQSWDLHTFHYLVPFNFSLSLHSLPISTSLGDSVTELVHEADYSRRPIFRSRRGSRKGFSWKFTSFVLYEPCGRKKFIDSLLHYLWLPRDHVGLYFGSSHSIVVSWWKYNRCLHQFRVLWLWVGASSSELSPVSMHGSTFIMPPTFRRPIVTGHRASLSITIAARKVACCFST